MRLYLRLYSFIHQPGRRHACQFEQCTFAELISGGALEIGDGYRAKNEELGGEGLIFLRAGHLTDTHIDCDGVERFHADLESRVRSKLEVWASL